MFGVVELRRAGDEIRRPSRAHISFENLVGIVKKTQDQVEAREVFGQFHRQLGIPREKSGKRCGFQRANRDCVEAFFGQRGDVFRAEDFEVRVGKLVPKQFNRGQREDEISDGAAANDQDAVQVSSA